MRQDSKVIGGREFTVSVLSFDSSKKVYERLHQILLAYSEETSKEVAIETAGSAGLLTDDLTSFLVKHFGPVTQVAMSADRTITLSKEESREEVFVGQFEDMFEWFDFCIRLNYEGVIAKKAEASRKLKAAAQAKASGPAE